MKTSTTRDKPSALSPALRLGAVAVWLLLWQLASMAVGLPLLLPSPLAVLVRLGFSPKANFICSLPGMAISRAVWPRSLMETPVPPMTLPEPGVE